MKILKRGIIGFNAEIIASSNPALVGIKGTIFDETRNMMVMKTDKGKKNIIKNTVTMMIDGIKVNGTDLIGTVDERIKKKVKK